MPEKKKQIVVGEAQVKDLRLDFGNPRQVAPEDLEQLKRSLSTFDDFGVILVNEKNQVIAGNQRVRAMHDLGWTKPVLVKRLVGFTRQELMTINIRANKHEGRFDNAMLIQWVDEIQLKGIEVELAGIVVSELEEIKMQIDDDLGTISRLGEGVTVEKEVKNKNWFYVEYYEQPARFKELKKLLGVEGVGNRIDPDTFYKLIKQGAAPAKKKK